MFRIIALLAAITALRASALADDKQTPLTLKPSTAWHLDYAEQSCRMARQFGEGDDQVMAIFTRYGPGERFHLVITGKPVKISEYYGEASVQFGPVEEVQPVYFSNGSFDKKPALVFGNGTRIAPMSRAESLAYDELTKRSKSRVPFDFEPAPVSEARQKAVKYLEIGKPLRRAVRLETGSMQAPLAAMDKCTDELMAHWGIDVEKHKKLSVMAKPSNYPGEWVTTQDYPMDMLQSRQPANVTFRLDVGVDGKPTGCHIVATTRPKEFDDAVCRSLTRRARFTPARDADGNPIASYYLNQVAFRIP